jgi:hypothetical protein
VGGGVCQHSVWRHNNIQSNLGWRLYYNVLSTDTNTCPVASDVQLLLTQCASRQLRVGPTWCKKRPTLPSQNSLLSFTSPHKTTDTQFTVIPTRFESITIFIKWHQYYTVMLHYINICGDTCKMLTFEQQVYCFLSELCTVQKSVKRLKLHTGQKCMSLSK